MVRERFENLLEAQKVQLLSGSGGRESSRGEGKGQKESRSQGMGLRGGTES